MKKLAFVPALVFLVAALLLPSWQSAVSAFFSFDTLDIDVPQHFDRCTDLQPSDLIDGVSFVTSDHGQELKVHSNGHLVVMTDLATGSPISVTLADGSEVRSLVDVRPSSLVPGWLQMTARDGTLHPSLVTHTNGLMQITEQGP